MGKRSTTNLSFVVGIDKPAGMTSHDVVDACRRIYGERRIGHTGTLDPAATGALAICVGPAARLDRYLTGHDKAYAFTIVFGSGTDTDDAQGAVVHKAAVPSEVLDFDHARRYVASLVGSHKQMPPVYSAIKVNGKRSYAAARSGHVIELEPRDIEIYETRLDKVETVDGQPVWHVRARVSAGTYVRSIARDAGHAHGTFAHVGELRRLASGNLNVGACVSLSSLESDPMGGILDPVKLLGLRFAFARGPVKDDVEHGRRIDPAAVALFAYDMAAVRGLATCECTSGVHPADGPLYNGEVVAMVVDNTLKALYEYDDKLGKLKSSCGFAVGVKRGADI